MVEKGSAIIEVRQCPPVDRSSWERRNLQPPKYVFDSANNAARDNISRFSSFVSHYDAVNSLGTASRERPLSATDIYESPMCFQVLGLLARVFRSATRRFPRILRVTNTFLPGVFYPPDDFICTSLSTIANMNSRTKRDYLSHTF